MEQTSPEPDIGTSQEIQKGSNKPVFIFLGIIVLFAVGLGGVLLGKFLYAPKTLPAAPVVTPTPRAEAPIATPTPEPTENWETYTNSKHLFEFKYPKNLVLRSYPADFQYDDRVNVEVEEKPANPSPGVGCFEFIFTVIYAGSDLQGYSGYLETDGESYQIKIGDREGLRIDDEPKIGYNCPSSKVIIPSRLDPNANDLVIVMIRPHNQYSELFDQILSTFKFIE